MAKNAVSCPACGVEELVHATQPGEQPIPLHEVGEFRCDACGARTVYGKVTPHLVVEPHRGDNGFMWIRIRRQDPKTRADLCEPIDLDPKLAFRLVKNLVSLVRV